MKGLNGKVVVVTGGGGGIGSATCLRFAEDGARVVVCDINAAAAQAVADRIRAAGGDAMALAVDLTDFAATTAAVGRIEDEFGRLCCTNRVMGGPPLSPDRPILRPP